MGSIISRCSGIRARAPPSAKSRHERAAEIEVMIKALKIAYLHKISV